MLGLTRHMMQCKSLVVASTNGFAAAVTYSCSMHSVKGLISRLTHIELICYRGMISGCWQARAVKTWTMMAQKNVLCNLGRCFCIFDSDVVLLMRFSIPCKKDFDIWWPAPALYKDRRFTDLCRWKLHGWSRCRGGHAKPNSADTCITWHSCQKGRDQTRLFFGSNRSTLFINPTGILELSTSSPEYLAWKIRSMVHVLNSYQLSIACLAVSRPLHWLRGCRINYNHSLKDSTSKCCDESDDRSL